MRAQYIVDLWLIIFNYCCELYVFKIKRISGSQPVCLEMYFYKHILLKIKYDE